MDCRTARYFHSLVPGLLVAWKNSPTLDLPRRAAGERQDCATAEPRVAGSAELIVPVEVEKWVRLPKPRQRTGNRQRTGSLRHRALPAGFVDDRESGPSQVVWSGDAQRLPRARGALHHCVYDANSTVPGGAHAPPVWHRVRLDACRDRAAQKKEVENSYQSISLRLGNISVADGGGGSLIRLRF